MKFKLFKVADVQTTVEELNASPEFQALGLPYKAKARNNWEAGAPHDEYPEWIVDIANYTIDELEEDLMLELQAMVGRIVFGICATVGDTIIVIDPENGDLPALLVADGDKEISGYRGATKGGKMVPFSSEEGKEAEYLADLNKNIDAIIEATPELSGYISLFR